MHLRSLGCRPARAVLPAALLWGLLAPMATAQQYAVPGCPPPPCATPLPTYRPAPYMPATPDGKPTPDQKSAADGTVPPIPQPSEPSAFDPSNLAAAPSYGGGSFGAAQIGAGYIDPAWIKNQLRIRYDSAYGNNRPDRAEFFYAKCGCLRNPPTNDPNSPGPPLPETEVDYQDLRLYGEGAFGDRFSVFVELPIRWLNPEVNMDTYGVGDVNFGGKFGIWTDPTQLLTFQLRTWVPTGNAERGLGTEHVSLEPAMLYHQQWDRLYFDGELAFWIPIDGTDFAGNIIWYGAGLSYNLAPCPEERFFAPVIEFIGWTVLDGKESTPYATFSAGGDTIVNAKAGVRFGWDLYNSVYVGYGRALTGAVWYEDIVRVEYRCAF